MKFLESSIKEVERLENLIKRNEKVRDSLKEEFEKGTLETKEHNKFVRAHNSIIRNTYKLHEAKIIVEFQLQGGMSSLNSIIAR